MKFSKIKVTATAFFIGAALLAPAGQTAGATETYELPPVTETVELTNEYVSIQPFFNRAYFRVNANTSILRFSNGTTGGTNHTFGPNSTIIVTGTQQSANGRIPVVGGWIYLRDLSRATWTGGDAF